MYRLPLVYGSGLWLGASIAYLRTMVKIHIFHTVPMIFPILLAFGLAPWILASYMEKYVAQISSITIIIIIVIIIIHHQQQQSSIIITISHYV